MDILVQCRNDPDLFNSAILGRPDYWSADESPQPEYPGQREWCYAIARYHTVAIETGNAVGKDYLVGGLVPWWLWTRRNSLVFVTGPGQTTLGSVTWKEIRRAIEGSALWQTGELKARISQGIKTSPHIVEVAPGHHALGFSTTTVERMSGQHAAELLVIVEEASGVEDHVWEAIDSLAPTKMVVIGNPLQADGGFARLCDQGDDDAKNNIPEHKAVKHFNVPSTASPHATMERSTVGLADASWLQQMARKWGVNSLWYKAHVAAIRPKISAEILVQAGNLEMAFAAKRKVLPPHHPIHSTRRISCDLAEGVGRDSTCFIVRDDYGVLECVYGNTMSLTQAAAKMRELGAKHNVPPERMSYDALGVGKNLHVQLAVYGLQSAKRYVGNGTPKNKSFANLRTEAAWKLRCRLDPEHRPDLNKPHVLQEQFSFCSGDYQEKLTAQIKVLTYELWGTTVKLLSKEDWLEILGFSPDIADALIQSFAY